MGFSLGRQRVRVSRVTSPHFRKFLFKKLYIIKMKVFKCRISGDELFTDSNRFEDVADAFYMVVCKRITMAGDNIQLDGANPSAEDADEGVDASEAQTGLDVVLHMRLAETGFGSKKDYMLYLKTYLKDLKAKLAEDEPSHVDKLPSIQKPITDILKNFKDLQFYTGESMNGEGTVGILDYKEVDGEEQAVIYFPKYVSWKRSSDGLVRR